MAIDGWISVKDRLPEIVYDDAGGVNCVLVFHKDGFDGGSDIQVFNAVCAANPGRWGHTHWQPLPEPPKDTPL